MQERRKNTRKIHGRDADDVCGFSLFWYVILIEQHGICLFLNKI